MGDGFGSAEEMTRLATTLDNSMDDLRAVAQGASPDVDAGSSTALVARTLAQFFEVSGGLVRDVSHQAGEVPNARAVYEQHDDAAAQGLPPLPLGDN